MYSCAVSDVNNAGTCKNRKTVLQTLIRNRFLILLALPGLLYFLIFKYVPMLGIIIAFKDYSPFTGIVQSPWVGLDNFRQFFSNPDFFKLFRNTMAISLLNLIFFFPFPILLSLLLNEVGNVKFKKVIQSIVYLPHFLSWVIIVGITFLMLSQSQGIVNLLLEHFGLEKVDFLTNSKTFWILLTVQSMWKEAGWGTIVFLAAIAGVDVQLYEAVKIDGGGRFRQIWHITLPAIRNVIIILLILKIGQIMDVGFEQVFNMMNGAVSDVADVFDTYVYRRGVQQGLFSFSTAVGLFKSVVGLVLVLISNKLAKAFGEEGVF